MIKETAAGSAETKPDESTEENFPVTRFRIAAAFKQAAGSAETKPELPTNEEASVEQKGFPECTSLAMAAREAAQRSIVEEEENRVALKMAAEQHAQKNPELYGRKESLPADDSAASEVEMLFREDQTLGSLLERVLRYKADVEKAEADLTEARKTLAIAKADLIQKTFEQGVESSFQALGKTVTRVEKVFPRFNKADEPKAFEWLQEIGQGSAIKPTVHPQTFGAIVRELLAEQVELPEFIHVFREWDIYVRQGSAK